MILKKYRSFTVFIISLMMFLYIFYTTNITRKLMLQEAEKIRLIIHRNPSNMKYILIWTNPSHIPINKMLDGQDSFLKRNCTVTNCFVIKNKEVMEVDKYDVIIFHGPELMIDKKYQLPKNRSPHQLYVFASIESSGYYPVEDDRYEGYFNLTWTYKLNSDKYFGYIAIKEKDGDVIGPKEEMNWKKVNHMRLLDDNIKRKLSNKNLLAAWFVSNCKTPGKRELFVQEVQKHLKEYNLSIDIYGKCGNKNCSIDKSKDCLNMIEKDYYFYFSLENSFSEDYVTEKLLHGLQHYAIPVVYGASNYSRFMPEGIYLDARKLGAKALVEEMLRLINDKEKYYGYFKWHNYYTYHDIEEVVETDPICNLCSLVNESNRRHIQYDFRKWWDR